jgi:amino acid adenylation domain-containing protein
MPELSERLCALSPEKLGLLMLSLRRGDPKAAEAPIIPHGENRRALPLSYAQERLWFLEQFQVGSPVYNVPAAIRLPGLLNVRALVWSFNEIVRRHDVLRTRFASRDGQPEQIVAPELSLELPVDDLQQHPAADREAKAQRLADEEARRVFDLSRGPLIRTRLLRLAPQDYILLLTVHHIVADGWSLGILFHELSVLYQAACQGKPSPLPPLVIQYSDFAQWQRKWLTGERLAAEVRYWRERLAGVPAVLALPTDRPRPAAQSYAGASYIFQYSRAVTERLAQISRESGSTLFMALLAAFKILLHRYTGQTDLVVGTPIANRNRTELEGLIGFFVNTVALRTDLSGDPSFREVLRRVKEVTLGAYEHQDLPFEKLVEELQPARKLEHHPLFQVLFALQNTPTLPEALGASDDASHADAREIGTGTAKFDLSIFFREAADGLVGGIEYSTELFDEPTIERMSRHLETLLAEIVANPEQRLSAFSLLTETEQQQIAQWNRTSVAPPEHAAGVCALFEAQVERTPEAAAVTFGDATLTYRELNKRANQLAHFLRTHGVGPEMCVGCCMEPSHEMMVGVLGILKTGGVYVPLDPSFPRQRLGFMVDDARISLILTQERFVEAIPANRARRVGLDTNAAEIGGYSDANLTDPLPGDGLAYVIYTSGSTGEPKGVALPHRSLLNLILWQNRRSTLSPGAKTLQFVSPSFDVSLQEMFTTWCSGGTLVLISEDARRDPAELLRCLVTAGVDRLFIAPVALQQLARAAAGAAVLPPLKEVIAAGDQLQITPSVSDLFAKLKNATLYNQYGPSESHVVSEFILPTSLATRKWLPPIGRPIANTQLYVLDPTTLNMLPVGVPGELCIGGASLARGYLNRPDLTTDRFVPDPFGERPGGRLYRTGDLARYRPDGNIEFLGRIDQQVKVRGFRIELQEVEAVLSRHDSVKETVVTASEDAADEKHLVAYVVPQTVESPTVTELRRFLMDRLPGYMVPSVFVFVDSLPLTATGKVDRRALLKPERTRPELEGGFAAPRNPVEEQLAKIWADVLGLDQVGVHDSFFDLGGHSLLGTRLISRVRDIFKRKVPLKYLFEAPSVAAFAVSLDDVAALNGQEEISNWAIEKQAPANPDPVIVAMDQGDETPFTQREPERDRLTNGKSTASDVASPSRISEPAVGFAKRRDFAGLTLQRGNEAQILARLDDLPEEDVTELLAELLSETEADPHSPPVAAPAAAAALQPPVPSTQTAAEPSNRTEIAAAPSGIQPSLSFQAPEHNPADVHRPFREPHLPPWYGPHLGWLDAQRRVAELHLHLWQTAHQLESTLQQQFYAELCFFSAAPEPWAGAFMPFPGMDNWATAPYPDSLAGSLRRDLAGVADGNAGAVHSNGFATNFPTAQLAVPPLQRKRSEGGRPSPQDTAQPRCFPASFAQQRLWFLAQLQPGSFAYNIPSVLRLSGPLNVRALQWSFDEIVRRHEVLRTTLRNQDGEPVQVVVPELALELPVEDLRGYRREEQQSEAQRLSTEEARYVFDLSRGPLIRVKLLRLAVQDHILLVTLHHIVADGWSLGILFRELSVLYEAACQGKPSPLPPLPIQYADFAQWQRRWLTGDRLAAEVQYWRERLAGAPAVLALPTDRPRPAIPSHAGAAARFQVPRELTEKLVQISQASGSTLFMLLLAAFKVLLYRHTRQEDLVVGTPIANRTRTELEGLIGFFVNQLALRTNLAGDPTFLEALGRVKEAALGAYEHQDVPFEKLVEELQPARSLAQPPLFQVIFGLQNNPTQNQPVPVAEEAVQIADSALPQVDWVTAKIDMNWQCGQTPEGLQGGVEYATDLFDAATIDRMARQFESLLAQVADDPGKPLSEFRLLSVTETGGRTLQDFPDLEITQDDFENLIMEIQEA